MAQGVTLHQVDQVIDGDIRQALTRELDPCRCVRIGYELMKGRPEDARREVDSIYGDKSFRATPTTYRFKTAPRSVKIGRYRLTTWVSIDVTSPKAAINDAVLAGTLKKVGRLLRDLRAVEQ